MKTLIRRESRTSRSNNLKARTKEKQWPAALSKIADWPRLEAGTEFRLCTGHDCLAKHLHRIGVYAQTTCSLCDLQEEMEKTHLIRCSALQTTIETQRYWEVRSQLMG
nr:reverse transcriptase [Hymenolepis microstoma]